MRDMFYNYEHHINIKEYSNLAHPEDDMSKDEVDSYAGAELVKNIKGEDVGIRFKYGCPIKLYFKVEGEIIDDNDEPVSIDAYLSSHVLRFEITETNKGLILSKDFNYNVIEGNVLVSLTKEEKDSLTVGIYGMRLSVITDAGDNIILHSDRDGFLSICM